METIEKIRTATFTLTRRGYDRREVDSYLSKLADWLEGGGADQVQGDTIKHELERIGQRTAKILTAAEEAARGMHGDAQREAREITESARVSVDGIKSSAEEYAKKAREEAQAYATKIRGEAEAHSEQVRGEAEAHAGRARQEADAYATKLRNEADGYAQRVRSEADTEAAEKVKEAEAKAIQMVEEGASRRREMEKVVADLQARRESVVKGLEKLSSQLAGAASAGKEGGDSADGGSPAGGTGLPTEEARRQVNDSKSAGATNAGSKPETTPSKPPPPSAPTRQ